MRAASLVRQLGRAGLSLVQPVAVKHKGQTLPAKRLRFGGAHFQDDGTFLASGEREAQRLREHCGLTAQSHLLEIGCGPGRLPIGIISSMGDIERYEGADVSAVPIHWCQKHITRSHPSFHFTHLDVFNARYNSSGSVPLAQLKLPFTDASFDCIYLYSVFSHLLEDDVRAYLKEFKRLLKPSGSIFLTAFVITDAAENCTENPAEYGELEWKGPLHCVLYRQAYFDDVLREHGFEIKACERDGETDGQSAYYLTHR